jgi:transcriptional regulator with XRE-family HTH domain
LLRFLRGRRSQTAVSRRLGYGTNVVYAWEAGRRAPVASEFFQLAGYAGVDVHRLVEDFARAPLALDPRRERGVQGLLRALAGARAMAELAREVGANRLTVTRWLRGTSQPRLPQLLRFVAATTKRLFEFVTLFAEPESLPSVRRAFRDYRAQLRVAYELPWSHAVLRALETSRYVHGTHEPGAIAALLGIDGSVESECLDALAQAGQIRRRQGRWVPTRVLAVDTGNDPDRNRMLKAHWAEVGRDRLRRSAGAAAGLFSYNLFAVTEHDFKRLRALHLRYFEEMRAIIAESGAPERVAVVNMQLFPLGQ